MSSLDKLAKMLSDARNEKKESATQNVGYHVQIKGDTVNVAGTVYPYTVVVDTPIQNGDWVWVVLNQSGTKAVVIGV